MECSECKRPVPELSQESVLLSDNRQRASGQVALNEGWYSFVDGTWICPGCAETLAAGAAEFSDGWLPRALRQVDDDRR